MRRWFVDFDDTLVIGPVTWALDSVLPSLIRENALPLDQARLDAALLRGQEQAASGTSEMEILDDLFALMGWPESLKRTLVSEVFDHYVPALFDDAIPFLRRASGVCVLSNNNHAPQIADALGIAPYVSAFFTPKLCGVERGKPQRDLWDAVCARIEVDGALLIGDDPWSDGAFAAACGINCLIVDRRDRFAALTPYPRVRSLAAVPDGAPE